uniref:Putative secreted protein n=1 Tax=Anopheles darlingi TaxID=43151 RepID=A0A2M4DNN7_ANODA
MRAVLPLVLFRKSISSTRALSITCIGTTDNESLEPSFNADRLPAAAAPAPPPLPTSWSILEVANSFALAALFSASIRLISS